MDSGEFSLHDQDAVRWAILFHDAIYDPMSKENEERSAQLAEVELASSIDAEKIALVVAMIRATNQQFSISMNRISARSMRNFRTIYFGQGGWLY